MASELSDLFKAQLDAIQSASRASYEAGYRAGYAAAIAEAQKIVNGVMEGAPVLGDRPS